MQENWKNDRKFVASLILTVPGIIALVFSVPDEFRLIMGIIIFIACFFVFILLFSEKIASLLDSGGKSFRKLSLSTFSSDSKIRKQRFMNMLIIVNSCISFVFFTAI